MTHKTKGIILRTVKYGETSLIVAVYTELFGLQSYLVKGIRKAGKSSAGKISYFQPAAILEMVVYLNPVKTIQFIREYQWAYIYKDVYFDVLKNAIATYIIEMILHTIHEQESNPELFYFIDQTLQYIDQSEASQIANIPLVFSLQLAQILGFQFHGKYSTETPILDLQEGNYIDRVPEHPYYMPAESARLNDAFMQIGSLDEAKNVRLSRINRQDLLKYYQQFFSLHLENFKESKSYQILQTVLQ